MQINKGVDKKVSINNASINAKNRPKGFKPKKTGHKLRSSLK
jgi:hypothetical protein